MTPREYADALVEHGYDVFPCNPTTKAPLTKLGFKAATSDEAIIEHWWTVRPDALVGVPNDKLLVVDIDPDGIPWLERHALRLGYGRAHRTRRGGWHLLYEQPSPPIHRSIGTVAKGVDICGVGGYTVWWPSAGLPCDGDLLNLVPPPDWLVEQMRGRRSDARAAPANWGEIVRNGAAEGCRNATLARVAGHAFRHLPDPYVAYELAHAFAAARCRPALNFDEAERTIQSIAAAEIRRREQQ